MWRGIISINLPFDYFDPGLGCVHLKPPLGFFCLLF
jgi:hypothetical protein